MIAYIYITHTCTYIKKVLISYISSLYSAESARKGLNPVCTNVYSVESARKGLSPIHTSAFTFCESTFWKSVFQQAIVISGTLIVCMACLQVSDEWGHVLLPIQKVS